MLCAKELDELKKSTHENILNSTKFIIDEGMDAEKMKVCSAIASSTKMASSTKYGIWPTTEFLEFLLTNNVIPSTPQIVDIIEKMVNFIVAKYNPKEQKWPFTDVEGCDTSAITSGHCIYVLKLYISRQFVDNTKREKIKKIIKEAEATHIADCRRDGSWEILNGDDAVDDTLNYGRIFHTFNAWFGIKRVYGYSDDIANLQSVRSRLSRYVINMSEKLIGEYERNKAQYRGAALGALICNMAKVIQILNDYDDDDCVENKKRLLQIVLQVSRENDIRNDLLHSASSVEIKELPNTTYNTFKNNIPFDLYFAVCDAPECINVTQDIIKWYADNKQKGNFWLWPGSHMNTWPTCEALLVLANAHEFFFETAIKQNCQEELDKTKEKYKQCEECKKTINNYLKPLKERFEKSRKDYIGKVKGAIIRSIIITVFVSVCAIAALIALSIVLEQYWLNTLITVVIVPLILQIAFVLKIPEYNDIDESNKQEVLNVINESESFWKDENN